VNKHTPPKIPLRFFRWYCHPDFAEDIEGDLLERFEIRLEEQGPKYAKWQFTKDVLRLFRPGIIRSLSGTKKMNRLDILINDLKLTVRSLVKNKVFSSINIAGLSIAFLVCLFSVQYAGFEYSYDSYHENKESIYRLVTDVETSTGTKLESTSIPMAPELAKQFPEIENFTRVFLDYLIVQSDQDNFQEEHIAYAEESLFDIFTFPLIYGHPAHVFDTPFNAVISETAALKYFGTLDCIGKELTLDGKTPSFITGVMKDIPENSHFKVDILLSLSSLIEVWSPGRKTNWSSFGTYSYLQVAEHSDATMLNDKISKFIDQQITQGEADYSTKLEPLEDIYLHGAARGSRTGSARTGNINNIYIFLIIAGLVLSIAVFNFINISSALCLNRTKEISMKKILGVSQTQQKMQHLLEAILFSVTASIIAITLFMLLTPTFNQLVGKPIIGHVFESYQLYLFIFGLSVIVGGMSGVFPTIILGSLKFEHLLRGHVKIGSKSTMLKNGFVIVQFAVSILMIVSAVVVTKQLTYLQTKELGYNKNHKLVIDFHFDGRVNKNASTIKEKLTALSGVNSVSISSNIPGQSSRKSMSEVPGANGEVVELFSAAYYVDPHFIDQYEIKILAGRGFDADRPSDYRQTMILNESAVRALGYNKIEAVIGQPFLQAGRWKGAVIGVIEDFHYASLREEIAPLTLSIARGYFTFMTLELQSNNIQHTVDNVESTWHELFPDLPMSYSFADQSYDALYKSDQQFSALTWYFALIAISLSLMGLLGLAALSTNDRIKEMGVRKILGASSFHLLALLSKDLLSLVILAMAIGLPISILSVNTWLSSFAYRLTLEWWMITPVIISILLLTITTIGSQVYKTAQTNPVDSLRDE
jgi:putative ABC transport system permease protein